MKVGFYETEITPPLGTGIVGYFHRREGSGVKERLYARAAVIENQGEAFGVLAIDCCQISDSVVVNAILDRVNAYTGIKKENIIINATHNHTGALFASKHLLMTEEEKPEVLYRAKLAADALILAYQRLEEATCRYGCGENDKWSFIRNYLMKDGTYFTNPPRNNNDVVEPVGKIDPSVQVLAFENKEGKLLGIITNYACHCDCVGGTEYSGDFPIHMELALQKQYGKDFVSVFLQGAAGNINDYDRSAPGPDPNRYIKMGQDLAKDIINIINTAEVLDDPVIRGAREAITLKLREIPQDMIDDAKQKIRDIPEPTPEEKAACNIAYPDDPTVIRGYAERLIGRYAPFWEAGKIETFVQVVRFGDCYFYCIPGELFNQYSEQIKANAPTKRTMVAELSQAGYEQYVPIPEFYDSDSVYEGKPSAAILERGEGQVLVDRALALGETLK